MNYVGSHARAIATYTGPPWRQPVPVDPPTEAQVALWREKYAATCSDKVARLLTALERDYAITGTATARSGPTAA